MSLYEFQEQGVRFLRSHLRAYLGDEMGLGKTVQALVAAWEEGLEQVLVVCPASLETNWQNEAREWAPGLDFRTVSYTRFAKRKDTTPEPELLILDEAHYLKNPKAKRTKALVGFIRQRPGLRVWMLSGTPMPNDPRELYVPAGILNPEVVDGYTAWKWMYSFCQVIQGPWGPKVVGVKNARKLQQIFSGRYLGRRLRQVALELPPLRVTLDALPVREDLPDELDGLLEAMKDEEVYGEGASRLRRLLGELKAPLVSDRIIREMGDGAYKAIVVMAYHRNVLDSLERAFSSAGLGVSRVDGATPGPRRQREVDLFQSGKTDIFLGQQTAAGIGVTLTRAHELVLVEPSWSPEDNAQAIKRIHRITQDAPCRARIFTLPGTLDEAVMQTVARKTRMIKEVDL